MCGGLGFVIGIVIFFGWRKSESGWRRGIANLCAAWMILSLAVYACVFLGS